MAYPFDEFNLPPEQQPSVGNLGLLSDGGINLSSAPAAAPIAPIPAMPRRADPRAEYFAGMSDTGRVFNALSEFGAGVTGRPSPMDARLKQLREEKTLRLQELKAGADVYDSAVKALKGLAGPARVQAAEAYAKQFDQDHPEWAKAVRALSAQDDGQLTYLAEYTKDSPTAKAIFASGGIGALSKAFDGETGKVIRAEIDSKHIPIIAGNLSKLRMQFQEHVPPAMVEKYTKDGKVDGPEMLEIIDWIKENAPAGSPARALIPNDAQMQIFQRPGNMKAIFAQARIASPEDVAAAALDAEKKFAKDEKAQSAVGKIEEDFYNGKITRAQADAAIAKANNISAGVTINMPTATGMGVNPGTGKAGHYSIGKDGTVRWDAIAPIESAAERSAKAKEKASESDFASVDRQITELENLVQKTEGKFTSATGIKGFGTRVAETASGIINPDAPTPALDAKNKKELLITAVRKSMADSNMSQRDKEALETAIGGIESAWGTKGSTLRGLKSLREVVRDKSINPGARDRVASPKTTAEFNALPSDALYIDPDDGKRYRKP